MHTASGAHVNERHNRGVLALLKRAHLAASDADVPHAAAWQYFDGIPPVVGFVACFIDRAHATRAERVHQRERAKHEALRLALKQTLSLEWRENRFGNEKVGKYGGLRPWVPVEELADDLVELPAVD